MKRKKILRLCQINFRLTVEQRETLRRKAWDKNVSVSNMVRENLERHGVIPVNGKNNV